MAEIILYSFMVGVAAFVYAAILQRPGEILSFMPKVADAMPTWLSKPLISCQKCVAGQLALWTFPLVFQWDLLFHVLTITTSIFFAVAVTHFFGDWQRPQKAPTWRPPEIY